MVIVLFIRELDGGRVEWQSGSTDSNSKTKPARHGTTQCKMLKLLPRPALYMHSV
jgi:hypothetical protein